MHSQQRARKKRTAKTPTVWRVALYIRLSREDGNDESLSVVNQRRILHAFLCDGFEGAHLLAGEYVDDGVTGTDYERPAFQRLLEDIETGAVNCVICKNLARAFRNYSDQGYFLESFFPRHAVRFVTLDGPRIDSFLEPDVIQGYEVPLSGIMNDRYAGRTSLDVRRTLDMKRRKGEFIGAFAPYGYQKDPQNKNRLQIDPEAAQVVGDIYTWFLEGCSKGEIVRRLNELGVANPALYKRNHGLRYFNPNRECNDGLWSLRTVSSILSNETYTGTMVQGRQRVINYKVHDCVSVPKEDWFVVENTHEPIVDRETFQLVQNLSQRNTRTAPGAGKVQLLAGVVFCGACGKAMHRSNARGISYLCCRTYREKSQRACQKHTVRADALERAVLEALQQQIAHLMGIEQIGEAVKQRRGDVARREQTDRELLRCKGELERLQRLTDGMYLDWKGGELSREDYSRMKGRMEEQKHRLHNRICRLEEKQNRGKDEQEDEAGGLNDFLRRRNILRLDRYLVVALVEHIFVLDGEVKIKFRFTDPCSEGR